MAELSVRFLPARQGDAIWVTWGDGHQLMIDMGTEQVGKQLAARLAALPEEERRFELLVVTHVDADHIGGVLTCVADTDDPIPGLAAPARAGATSSAPTAMATTIHADRVRLACRVIANLPE
jgi:glyoxylase-like metal-dependent hydrolase (beta-lactamase superfamily II)